MGEQRQSEAAHAAIGERDGVGDVAVGHDRRDRAERLDIVDRARCPRIVGAEQDRLHEGAAFGPGRGVGIAGDDPRARGDQLGDLGADVVALGAADQRAHAGRLVARVADAGAASRSRIAASSASRCSAGAMARRMAVHFCPALTVISIDHFLDEQVEFRRSGRGVGAEHEALRLSCSATKLTLSRATPGGAEASARSRPSR